MIVVLGSQSLSEIKPPIILGNVTIADVADVTVDATALDPATLSRGTIVAPLFYFLSSLTVLGNVSSIGVIVRACFSVVNATVVVEAEVLVAVFFVTPTPNCLGTSNFVSHLPGSSPQATSFAAMAGGGGLIQPATSNDNDVSWEAPVITCVVLLVILGLGIWIVVFLWRQSQWRTSTGTINASDQAMTSARNDTQHYDLIPQPPSGYARVAVDLSGATGSPYDEFSIGEVGNSTSNGIGEDEAPDATALTVYHELTPGDNTQPQK